MCQFNVETVNYLKLIVQARVHCCSGAPQHTVWETGSKGKGPKKREKNVRGEEQKKVLSTVNHKRAAQQLVEAAQWWGGGVSRRDKSGTFP